MSHSSSMGLLWLSSVNDGSSIGLPWLSSFNDGSSMTDFVKVKMARLVW